MSTAESLSQQPAANSDGIALLREPQFPFPKTAIVQVAEGCAGIAVLWYRPGLPTQSDVGKGNLLPAGTKPWFQLALVLRGAGNSVEIHPPSCAVILVDFKDGFEPTPFELFPYAHAYLEHGKIVQALRNTGRLHWAAPELNSDLREARLDLADGTTPPSTAPDGVPGDCPIIT